MTWRRAVCVLSISAVVACDDSAPVVVPSRVVAVTGRAVSGPDLAGFCDRYAPEEQAGQLVLPALDGAAPAVSARPRWVNVWATWCKPCVEEMPRLLAWQKRLAEQGKPIDLVFISVDVTADAVAQFRAEHDAMPESLHVAGPDALSAWLPQVGLGEGSPIPMHLYADARGTQRCVRAGAVAETDFTFVEALLQRHP
jgi:thiol-disulfide isomerase/thioredoxin